MIHRLDIAKGNEIAEGLALKQLTWSALAVAIAAGVLVALRDHRALRRYTFTAAAVGFGLLILPLVPGLGRQVYGSRIWIGLGPFSFQPGEIAKIARGVLRRLPRADPRRPVARWAQGPRAHAPARPRPRTDPRRLGEPRGPHLREGPRLLLLFFGLFVAMLYVATERRSWIAIGLILFCGGAYLAFLLFGHVQQRVMLWLVRSPLRRWRSRTSSPEASWAWPTAGSSERASAAADRT